MLSCAQRTSRRQLTTQLRTAKTTSDELMKEVGEKAKAIADLTQPIRAVAADAKQPSLQVVYFGASALAHGKPHPSLPPLPTLPPLPALPALPAPCTTHVPGEVFDICCFTGINQYHCLRVEGECAAAHLSSQHMRSTDFEMMCNPPEDASVDHKEAFAAATRDKYLTAITYQASIHLAWEASKNHERITPNSFGCLQSTRGDLHRMQEMQLDPQAEIVTVIMDVVTDKLHFHFVKDKPGAHSIQKKVILPANIDMLARSYPAATPQLPGSYPVAIR